MISEQGDGLVFLLGVPRSGTTLLATMLAQHPQIVSPPEPWLMLALESLGKTPFAHPADPQLIGEAVAKFANDAAHIDAARAYALTIYNRVLADSGRSVLIDKTPRYYLILPFLKQLFPNAKYIWLKRNPLDVAVSFKTTWMIDLPAELRAGMGGNRGIAWTWLHRAAHAGGICRCQARWRWSMRFPTSNSSPSRKSVPPRSSRFWACPRRTISPILNCTTASWRNRISVIARSWKHNRRTRNPSGNGKKSLPLTICRPWRDAVGVSLFRRLGYDAVLTKLAELGVSEPSAETTAIATARRARYAERLTSVQAICSLRGNGIPGPTPKTWRRCFPTRSSPLWCR